MCGIAGITGKDLNKQWIFSMAESLKHRGPDDEGYLLVNTDEKIFEECGGEGSKIYLKHIRESVSFDVNLSLGHRRLSILDPSPAGHQPMKYERNGRILWIVYNGEVYNYLELREELRKKGYEFRTDTDTEVILASYLEWGFDCVRKFNGMWAFVIYDPQKNILFGSRDRYGVKPLYYYKNKDVFVFASEIKAILALPFVERKANESILYDYLVYGILEHSEETFFDGIYKVPQSHSFIYYLENKELNVSRYYELEYNKSVGEFSEQQLEKYIGKLKELISRAVDLRLRSDVPVGTCLSGGIDSSTIAVIINEMLKNRQIPQIGERQKVFTAAYDGKEIDESRFAQEVVNRTDAEWHRTYPESKDLMKDLEDLIYYQEEPFGSTSIYAQYRVMRLAKDNGVKVLLDGQGGDELFTGYQFFYASFFLDLVRNFRFGRLIHEMMNLKNSPLTVKSLLIQIAKILYAKFIPARFKVRMLSMLQPELRYINKNSLSKFSKRDPAKGAVSTSLNETCYIWFTGHNLQQLLKYEDRNSMAHSIEARVPFSDDTELVEYVFSIPAAYKIHNGWSKYLLREAMADLLPDVIRKRTDKIGFATPEKEWLMEAKDELKRLLDWDNPYINTKKLIDDLDVLVERMPESGLNMLWRVINAVLWMRIFDVKPSS